MEQVALADEMEGFAQEWVGHKKQAIESGDYSFYRMFLEEVYRAYAKLYAELELPEAISLAERVLKIASCELKESVIKYKGGRALSMKEIKEMTDGELEEAWEKGKVWMMRTQDHADLWKVGLKRLEDIEDEMKRRNMWPWKKTRRKR